MGGIGRGHANRKFRVNTSWVNHVNLSPSMTGKLWGQLHDYECLGGLAGGAAFKHGSFSTSNTCASSSGAAVTSAKTLRKAAGTAMSCQISPRAGRLSTTQWPALAAKGGRNVHININIITGLKGFNIDTPTVSVKNSTDHMVSVTDVEQHRQMATWGRVWQGAVFRWGKWVCKM